jgi:CheY-like chemotaxis protein
MAFGSRILLVDDSLLSRKIASAALVDVALSERLDLILLDLGLPGISGYDVARHLRAYPDMQHVPIIAVTGDDTQEAFEEAQMAGINSLIVKPVDRDYLVQTITTILG